MIINSHLYRKKIKRMVQAYKNLYPTLQSAGKARASLHYFAEVSTVDETRRSRGERTEMVKEANVMPKDSVKY